MEIRIETLTAEVGLEEFIAGYVDVERFEACCAQCRGWGRTWACPPYDFDPMEIWKSYSSILLFAKKVTLPDEEVERVRPNEELASAYNTLLEPVKRAMMEELYKLEREHPGSLALSAGGCDVCETCTRGEGLPCRAPDRMRYSVESIGGDVLKSIDDFLHEEVLWAENGHLPRHYILLGGLLK